MKAAAQRGGILAAVRHRPTAVEHDVPAGDPELQNLHGNAVRPIRRRFFRQYRLAGGKAQQQILTEYAAGHVRKRRTPAIFVADHQLVRRVFADHLPAVERRGQANRNDLHRRSRHYRDLSRRWDGVQHEVPDRGTRGACSDDERAQCERRISHGRSAPLMMLSGRSSSSLASERAARAASVSSRSASCRLPPCSEPRAPRVRLASTAVASICVAALRSVSTVAWMLSIVGGSRGPTARMVRSSSDIVLSSLTMLSCSSLEEVSLSRLPVTLRTLRPISPSGISPAWVSSRCRPPAATAGISGTGPSSLSVAAATRGSMARTTC